MPPPKQQSLPFGLPIELDSVRCLLVTESGDLLWRSSAWRNGQKSPNEEHQVTGKKWWAFMCEHSFPHLLEFLADGKDGTGHTFYGMLPSTGQCAKIHWIKHRWQKHWLVSGDFVVTDHKCGQVGCHFLQRQGRTDGAQGPH